MNAPSPARWVSAAIAAIAGAAIGIAVGGTPASMLAGSTMGSIVWFGAMALLAQVSVQPDWNRLSPWIEAEQARCTERLIELGPQQPDSAVSTDGPDCDHARATTLYRYGHGVIGRSCPDCGLLVDVPGGCRHAGAVPVEAGGETVARLCLQCGEQLAPTFCATTTTEA